MAPTLTTTSSIPAAGAAAAEAGTPTPAATRNTAAAMPGGALSHGAGGTG